MESVGLFEAKTHLSEYVARAEAGEEVIITRHSKPVAKIVPCTAMDVQSEEEARHRTEAIEWLLSNRIKVKLEPGETLKSWIEDERRF